MKSHNQINEATQGVPFSVTDEDVLAISGYKIKMKILRRNEWSL